MSYIYPSFYGFGTITLIPVLIMPVLAGALTHHREMVLTGIKMAGSLVIRLPAC